MDLTDPQSWNGYAYVRNRPLSDTDPSGLQSCPAPCISYSPVPGQTSGSAPGVGGSGWSLFDFSFAWGGTPPQVTTLHHPSTSVPPDYGVVDALGDSFVGYGKEAYNTYAGIGNMIDGAVDSLLSPFTSFRVGKMSTAAPSNATQRNAMWSMAVFTLLGTGGESGVKLVSSIGENRALIRLAEEAGASVQTKLDSLAYQLFRGNLNPGIGTKDLFGNTSYARARNGARVFFRKSGNTIEILAKANKQNEQQVINKLMELYK